MADIPDYHTTPVQAAESANEAGVPLLLHYHLNPPPPNPIAARVFLRGVSPIRKDGVLMARDGMLIELPIAGGPATDSQLPSTRQSRHCTGPPLCTLPHPH